MRYAPFKMLLLSGMLISVSFSPVFAADSSSTDSSSGDLFSQLKNNFQSQSANYGKVGSANVDTGYQTYLKNALAASYSNVLSDKMDKLSDYSYDELKSEVAGKTTVQEAVVNEALSDSGKKTSDFVATAVKEAATYSDFQISVLNNAKADSTAAQKAAQEAQDSAKKSATSELASVISSSKKSVSSFSKTVSSEKASIASTKSSINSQYKANKEKKYSSTVSGYKSVFSNASSLTAKAKSTMGSLKEPNWDKYQEAEDVSDTSSSSKQSTKRTSLQQAEANNAYATKQAAKAKTAKQKKAAYQRKKITEAQINCNLGGGSWYNGGCHSF